MMGRKICPACTDRNRSRERRNVAAGFCRCGRSEPVKGGKVCRVCADHKAELARRLREKVFGGYGGRCVCCGEKDYNVLQLDHVNNDGNRHRAEVKTTYGVYLWAIREGYPARLQLLCGNCHLAKTRAGDCSYRRGSLPKGGAADHVPQPLAHQ